MAKYLVTGVAGFLGGAVATALAKAGHFVIGLDNLSIGNRENVPPGVRFAPGDCLDEGTYTDALAGESFDAVFHLAGQDNNGYGPDGPAGDLRANAESTLRLLRFAEAVGCPRFIYRSSAAVYGPQPDEPVREDAPLHPDSFSGISKLASEHYLRLYESRGISSTALRLFTVYGPVETRADIRRSMVAEFVDMMARDGHIHVRGGPNRCRDFVYIDDAVRAFLSCLERPGAGGKALNIGGSGKTMVGDVVDKLCALSSRPVTVEYSGYSDSEAFGNHADISMAAKYLGYEPEIGLDQGLVHMHKWRLNNGT